MCPGYPAAVDGLVQQDAGRGSGGAGLPDQFRVGGAARASIPWAQADTGLDKVMANVHVRMCLTTMLP